MAVRSTAAIFYVRESIYFVFGEGEKNKRNPLKNK